MKTLRQRHRRLRATYVSEQEVGNLFNPPISVFSFQQRQRDPEKRIRHNFIGMRKYYNIQEVYAAIEREKSM